MSRGVFTGIAILTLKEIRPATGNGKGMRRPATSCATSTSSRPNLEISTAVQPSSPLWQPPALRELIKLQIAGVDFEIQLRTGMRKVYRPGSLDVSIRSASVHFEDVDNTILNDDFALPLSRMEF